MVTLEIAGISFGVEACTPVARSLLTKYSAYVRSVAEPAVRLTLGADRPHEHPDLSISREEAWLTLKRSSVRIGRAAPEGYMVRLWMHALAFLLARAGGLVVHAAAVEGRTGAIAFLGPSGAGKTASAANCPARLLNPDRVAIGMSSGVAWLAPVPFLHCEPQSGRVDRMPLACLAFVEKSPENRIERVAERERASRLLASVLMPPDPDRAALALRTAQLVLEAVPPIILHARKEGGFWPLLDRRDAVATWGPVD